MAHLELQKVIKTMTVFKIYEYDGFFFYSIKTNDLKKAVRMLFKTFGDKIKYDIV